MNQQLRSSIVNCKLCNSLGINYNQEREENFNFAYHYLPEEVKVLWIVESPPKSDPPRYFYRSELTRHDSLFRETMKALKIPVTDSKTESLKEFKEKGHFLIDSMKCPADKDNSYLKPQMRINCSDLLKEEIIFLKADSIIIIKADVYSPVKDLIYKIDEENSGLNLSSRILNDQPIPFPGSGQQKKFRDEIQKFLNLI